VNGVRPLGGVREDGRGQLVLAAAGVVAVAVLAMTVAYLQLGAHPDVDAERDVGPREAVDRGVAVLDRAVAEAKVDRTGTDWANRSSVVDRVRADLRPAMASLRTARVARGVAYAVDYDREAAREYAARACPSGDGRAFGDCEARRGVVVQERAGETTVLAVAFELTVTTPDGDASVTVVL